MFAGEYIDTRWVATEYIFTRFNYEASKITDCFFVEIGANNGKHEDPLYHSITTQQWHGILVEPDAEVFKALTETYYHYRGNLIFEQCAISDVNGSVELYTGTLANLKAQDSTMHYTLLKGQGEFMLPIDPHATTVPSMTADKLLEKHNVTKVDVLMTDVEGYDFVVLKTFPFHRIRPKIIIAEFCAVHHMGNTVNELGYFLEDLGYTLHMDMYHGDLIGYRL